jgi:hypothetical protein
MQGGGSSLEKDCASFTLSLPEGSTQNMIGDEEMRRAVGFVFFVS